MTSASSDMELIERYATASSEAAFHALVARHASLVYATAYRQLGDAGAAEEVAQNVFLALARKAHRLQRARTLAGWLHQTTLLEAKSRIRSDLRRKRRESAAAELDLIRREGTSMTEALVPMLDEALVHLREGDRLALILRFLNGCSLREVGAALGIEEDAARKRVTRALDRLTGFFRSRGFAVSGGAASAILMAGAAQAAPAGFASAAAGAALTGAACSAGTPFTLIQFMSLSKTPLVVAAVLVVSAPLIWQRTVQAQADRDRTEAASSVAMAARQTEEMEQRAEGLRDELTRLQEQVFNREARLSALEARREGRTPPPVYEWNDFSPLVRFPKAFLQKLPVDAVRNRNGELTAEIRETLQMSEAEAGQTQEAMFRFLDRYQDAQAPLLEVVDPVETDLKGHLPEETRVFEVPALPETLAQLRETLFHDLQSTLGPERFGLFKNALDDWMPLDEEANWMNTSMAVYNFDHRIRFYQPQPGDDRLEWSLVAAKNRGSMSAMIALDEVPSHLRPHLQDWIDLARSAPPPPPKPEGVQP